MKYNKILQVHLTEGQHEALRGLAFKSRVSMVEVVRGWVDGIGSNVYREVKVESPVVGVGKVTTVESKPVVGQSGAIGGVGGTCSLCGKSGVKTALNKDRKWICYECAGVKS